MNPEVVNVYILKNDVGSFYCGITNNLARRIEEHRAGMSVYTSRFSGWYLVWNEEFENRKVARMLEVQIKNFGVGRWYRKHKPASSPVGSLAWGGRLSRKFWAGKGGHWRAQAGTVTKIFVPSCFSLRSKNCAKFFSLPFYAG